MRKISKRNNSSALFVLEKQRDYFHSEIERLSRDSDYCPYTWSFDSEISDSGDITVTFFEHEKAFKEKSFYRQFFSSSEIIELIKKYCSPYNRFRQPIVEGHLQSFISKSLEKAANSITKEYLSLSLSEQRFITGILSDNPTTEKNESGKDFLPKYRKNFKLAVTYYAILSAFRSSSAYDSPYGGGKNSVFDLPSLLRQ